jgi:hypothetical protein
MTAVDVGAVKKLTSDNFSFTCTVDYAVTPKMAAGNKCVVHMRVMQDPK